MALNCADKILAYHDRSDGGLFVTVLEMAFAGHLGVDIDVSALGENDLEVLFSEELGAVIQIDGRERRQVLKILEQHHLAPFSHVIGRCNDTHRVSFTRDGKEIVGEDIFAYRRIWSTTTHQMQRLRDNPDCALQEQESRCDPNDPGLSFHLTFDPSADSGKSFAIKSQKPKIAILREQGINGQVEMAAAFDRAGFVCIDVPMSDVLAARISLADFNGLIACGGFSYGDVFGAGVGWAKSILYHNGVREEFARFFARTDTFALGVCNGCQMLAHLKELIPGSDRWPRFCGNTSQRFESRYVTCQIEESKSLFFAGMQGSRIPIVVAHAEGRASFEAQEDLKLIEQQNRVCLRLVDNYGAVTTDYPANPNGSPAGITGLTTADGRVTIMMPHPERVFQNIQYSSQAYDTARDSPWMQMFYNARKWCDGC